MTPRSLGTLPQPEEQVLQRWKEWKTTLTRENSPPLCQLIWHLTSLTLGDTITNGVSATVYAVGHQDHRITQLICVNSRLAKKNLTKPRLELFPGHMALNMVMNAHTSLSAISHTAHCWLDWTVLPIRLQKKCRRSSNTIKSSGTTFQLRQSSRTGKSRRECCEQPLLEIRPNLVEWSIQMATQHDIRVYNWNYGRS